MPGSRLGKLALEATAGGFPGGVPGFRGFTWWLWLDIFSGCCCCCSGFCSECCRPDHYWLSGDAQPARFRFSTLATHTSLFVQGWTCLTGFCENSAGQGQILAFGHNLFRHLYFKFHLYWPEDSSPSRFCCRLPPCT